MRAVSCFFLSQILGRTMWLYESTPMHIQNLKVPITRRAQCSVHCECMHRISVQKNAASRAVLSERVSRLRTHLRMNHQPEI